MTASYSQFGNTTRRNFTFQILPRVSGTLRYSTINDWGRPDDPDYDLFDRSFDLQFQLLKEQRAGSRRWRSASATSSAPASTRPSIWSRRKTVARDFTRHRRHRLGAARRRRRRREPVLLDRRQLLHPRRRLRRGRQRRPSTRFFHGEDMGFFGGVEWRTPIDKLTLKAEISSDAYTREQRSPTSDFERKSPINFGAEYRVAAGHHARRLLHVRRRRSASTSCCRGNP